MNAERIGAPPPGIRWRFLLGMLRREFRSSWKRLVLLVLCIAAGVGGLVAVQSFSVALTDTIRSEARTLLAADISLRSNRPFTQAEDGALADLQRDGASVARSVEFVSMAQAVPAGPAPKDAKASASSDRGVLLVEARAVGDGYPFYGEVLVQGDRPFRQLLRADTVVVHPSLLLHMHLQVGDSIRLGRATFRIAGELVKEPDSPVMLMNIGPRILMTEAGGAATGLIAPTSRVRYTALIKLPATGPVSATDVPTVTEALKKRLANGLATVASYDQAQPQVTRFLGQLTNFLNLTGLVALLLGGIGVAGAIRVFMAQKLDTLAVLKCLGATSGQLLAVYLAQALLLGLIGSVIGVALGTVTQWVLARLLVDFLPVSVRIALSWRAVAQGVLLGGLVTLWFSLPPLLMVRRVPPARVFRRAVEAEPGPAGPGWWRWLRAALAPASGILLIGAVAYWQVGNWRLTWIFVVSLAGTALGLLLVSQGLLWALRRVPRPPAFVLRQGLTALYRPGNQTRVTIMSLGLSMLLLLAVFLVQQDLLRQVKLSSRADQPNLFFIDIQKQQRQPFLDVVTGAGYPAPELIPVVRGRIVALNGKRIKLEAMPEGDLKRVLTFEYAFTYRGALMPGEHVIAGQFASDPAVSGPQVSAADWWMNETHMKLGDTVTMDIQGVPVLAAITSIREIEWSNRRANFSFVYLPGVLEAAPQIYVTGVHSATDAERAELQRRVVERLPNVTGIDVETVFRLIQQILDRIALVIQFMAGFSLAVGLVILLGAIATTKYQRIREAVLLKTLGATRGMVARILALEYVFLGGLAGLIGVGAAGAFSYVLVTWVFEGRWYFALTSYLAAWALSTALVTATGLLSSTDVLLRKPLEVLREE